MRPEVLDASSQPWRLLTRHRRDLVDKAATLKIQLKETIDAYLPGYSRLWKGDNFWDSPVPASIATTFDSPQALRDTTLEQFRQLARHTASMIPKNTVARIRAWTHQAAAADDGYPIHFRRAVSLWGDLQGKRQEIALVELDWADFLCRSPCLLLLAFPGIHLVSASDYGAELGPITNYATSKSIAGRAGLYPARWQSAHTDHPDGPLVARRNRQLRAALMRLARNLVLDFYLQRHAAAQRVTQALDQAVARLSGPALRAQRDALDTQHRELKQQRRRTTGMCRLGEILPQVLLRIQQRLQEETNQNQLNPSEPRQQPIDEDVTHGS